MLMAALLVSTVRAPMLPGFGGPFRRGKSGNIGGVMRATGSVLGMLAASLVLGAEAESPLRGVNANDAKALLAAGISLEEKGRGSLALPCYRRVLTLGPGPAHAEAAYRLGKLELARKEYESAFAHLREAAEKHAHEGARAILRTAESKDTEAQRKLLEKGDASFAKGRYGEARGFYDQAWALFPPKPAPLAFAPRKDVLRLLARCQDLIDDEHYKLEVQPAERSIRECGQCSKDGGFVECTRCKGKGGVPVYNKLLRRDVILACPDCRVSQDAKVGTGWVFCRRCVGLEHYTESDRIKADEKKAIIGVVNKVRNLNVLSQPLGNAIAAVEDQFLKADRSTTLDFFRSMKPRYRLSQTLRTAVGQIPASPALLRQAAGAWREAGADARIRSNFLISYSIEYGRWLKQFEMLRKSKKSVDFAKIPSASSLAADAITPELLSAFPDEDSSGWTAVTAYFKKLEESGSDPMKGRLELESDLPHNVHFFVWLPAASEPLRRFDKGPWASRVAGLGSSYPFAIRERVLKVKRGQRVVLAGRFLRDRLGYPRNWFEVWDIHVGLDREAEAAYAVLAQPVLAETEATKASEIAQLIQVLHGVEVVCGGGSGDLLLQVSAADAPLGLVLADMAKALGVPWSFEGGAARLGEAPRRSLDPVLEELRRMSRGTVSVKRSDAAPSAPLAQLPDDPAALDAGAKKAMAAMDYALAARHLEKLAAKVSDAAEKRKADLLGKKALIFHDLTGATPRSGLAGAKDVVQLTIRNPSGDVNVETVRIIEEKDGVIRCVPRYGGTLGIRSELVKKREPLSGDEWRRRRDEEMREQLKKLTGMKGKPREMTGELFLLALFAKTNGFPGRGTQLLEKVLDSDEFAWLVSTYFPARSRSLVETWREVTGRKDITAAPPESAPEPSVESKLSPSEPLPGSVAELLPYARRHRDQGRVHLSRSLPGMPQAEENLKLARDHFRASQTAFEKLGPRVDADPAAKALSREVAELLHACIKGLGFFD